MSGNLFNDPRIYIYRKLAANVYNALLLNHIQLEILKILRKNQNEF